MPAHAGHEHVSEAQRSDASHVHLLRQIEEKGATATGLYARCSNATRTRREDGLNRPRDDYR